MSHPAVRAGLLTGILLLGYGLLLALRPASPAVAQGPGEDALFVVEGWSVSPAQVDGSHGLPAISREYLRADGTHATLVITTAPRAEYLYRTPPELPFLGSGYTVAPVPPTVVAPAAGWHALLLSSHEQPALLLYAYGERRGLLGNGVTGWSHALLDAALGRANAYYLLRCVVPLEHLQAAEAHAGAELVEVLFPRLAAWYAEAAVATEPLAGQPVLP
jgi:hypothetical protein